MVVANLCSHSLTAVFHLDTNVGLSLSTNMGLMVILSLAGVLPLKIILDRASWWFVALSKVSTSSRYRSLNDIAL